MSKEDLGSFKIGDMRRPEVKTYGRGATAEPEEAAPSVGFPSIETRLEGSGIEAVADELRSSYEQLEALSTSGDVKEKAAAKRAMVAYERAADLFEYLFTTKEAMVAPPSEE